MPPFRDANLRRSSTLLIRMGGRNTEELVIRRRGQLAATFEEDLGLRLWQGLRLGPDADIRVSVAGQDLLALRALPDGNLQIGQMTGYTETTIFGEGETGAVVDSNGYLRTTGLVLSAPDGTLWLVTVESDGMLHTARFSGQSTSPCL